MLEKKNLVQSGLHTLYSDAVAQLEEVFYRPTEKTEKKPGCIIFKSFES